MSSLTLYNVYSKLDVDINKGQAKYLCDYIFTTCSTLVAAYYINTLS